MSGESHSEAKPSVASVTRAREARGLVEAFLEETLAGDRAALLRELNAAIVTYLEFNIPVYLEGLGIVIPSISTVEKSHPWQDKLITRSEIVRSVAFEKCYELTAFHRERYPGVIETRELAKRIYPRLPLPLSVEWCERRTRRALKGLIANLKQEIVLEGRSGQLGTIGDFYALHNRQGDNLRDWYAGADIFLDPFYEDVLEIGPSRFVDAPVYEDAWEPLIYAYGEALHSFKLSVADQLFELGYEAPAISGGGEAESGLVPVAVFLSEPKDGADTPALVYCTEGLRRLAFGQGHALGTEVVFQLPVRRDEVDSFKSGGAEIPEWPARCIAMAWILQTSSKSKHLTIGSGLSCGLPIRETGHVELDTVFVTAFARFPAPLSLRNGNSVAYMNVVGITDDEARVAKIHSPEHLTTLLRYKKLDQHTKISRSSIVQRTNLLESVAVPEAGARRHDSSGPSAQPAPAQHEPLIPRGKIVNYGRRMPPMEALQAQAL